MNVSAIRWLLLLGLLALAAAADEYDEYEDAPAPAPVKPLRPSPLLRQARGPVIGRPAPKSAATKTTTTTTEAPAEYDEEEEEGVVEDVTTTTEAPKRAGVRTGVVRPFRSNTDLIESLKRRRQQQHNAPTATTSAAPSQTTERASKAGRRPSPESDQASDNKNTRKFSGRNKFKTEASTTEPPEEPTPKTRLSSLRSRKF